MIIQESATVIWFQCSNVTFHESTNEAMPSYGNKEPNQIRFFVDPLYHGFDE
jgi:hypothetical protein